MLLIAVQYCPDEALYLCDALCNLRGILQKSRISGFTLPYTEMLLCAIFAEGDIDPDYNTPEDLAWPPVPAQTPFQSFDPLSNTVSTAPMFELSFTPTSSFAQDVEDEMLKYESSVYSDKTNLPMDDSAVKEEPGLPKSGAVTSITEHVQRYQNCVGSIDASDQSKWGQSGRPNSNSDQWSSHQLQFLDNPLARNTTNGSQRGLLAATPCTDSRCPTPKSPNTMNQMNEQDPAFLRTLQALRSLDEPNIVKKPRPKSMIPSPKSTNKDVTSDARCKTSMSTYPRAEGAVRKYFSFVQRLRGRSDPD